MKKDVSGETSEPRCLLKTLVQIKKAPPGNRYFNSGIMQPYPFFSGGSRGTTSLIYYQDAVKIRVVMDEDSRTNAYLYTLLYVILKLS